MIDERNESFSSVTKFKVHFEHIHTPNLSFLFTLSQRIQVETMSGAQPLADYIMNLFNKSSVTSFNLVSDNAKLPEESQSRPRADNRKQQKPTRKLVHGGGTLA
jgi:hypothetical protein